jgi:hypothetical protein
MKCLAKKSFDEIHEHDNVLLLADIPGVPLGTLGTVIEKCEENENEVTYRWIIVRWKLDRPTYALPVTDSFDEKTLNHLAFESL